MPSINDIVERRVNEIRAVRGAPPPIPVQGEIQPPGDVTAPELGEFARSLVDRAGHALGMVGKAALRPLTFSVEALARGDDVFRATALAAGRRIPLNEYPDYVKRAREGTGRISGSEFVQLAVGQSFWQQLDKTPLFPGWTKKIVYPEGYLGKRETEEPVVSFGDVAGVAAEFFMS